ncbi:MAG: transcription elongation factor GreA [Frankiaceae bacterium]|nr:transcription elongation factor GreA [Frankiaceae bacterium]MBV9870833.1 transcription elongation factor GreA [Frankiaceae bacterium]
MSETTETWLTQEAYDRLAAELEHLSGPARVEITQRIAAARAEGDLKENGGYHAAKDEQGKMEARIRQLNQILRTAKVGTPPSADSGVAGPGMVVTVKYVGDDDTETFLIGSREEAAVTDMTVYSAQSPMGKALTGAKPGETVSYKAPSGAEISLEIVEVDPYTG